jgi:hypothetical protein
MWPSEVHHHVMIIISWMSYATPTPCHLQYNCQANSQDILLTKGVHPLESFLWSLYGSFVMNRPITHQRFWFNNIKVTISTFVFIIKSEPLMSDQTVHNKRTAELSRECAPTYEVSWSTFCSVSILMVHDIINKLVVLICHHIYDLYFLDPKKLINYDCS